MVEVASNCSTLFYVVLFVLVSSDGFRMFWRVLCGSRALGCIFGIYFVKSDSDSHIFWMILFAICVSCSCRLKLFSCVINLFQIVMPLSLCSLFVFKMLILCLGLFQIVSCLSNTVRVAHVGSSCFRSF